MTRVPGQRRGTSAGRGSRGRAVRRFLSAYGLIDVQHTEDPNTLLTDRYAIRVEGARGIKGNRTPSMVLRDLKEKYPRRIPVLVRTVHPEVEQALVHTYAEDFRRLIAWDEREVRL